MPKRNRMTFRQPRRISRNTRKGMQNAYRTYTNKSRSEIRKEITLLMRINVTIALKGKARCNKIGLGFEPGSSYLKRNPNSGSFIAVDIHGTHLTSTHRKP